MRYKLLLVLAAISLLMLVMPLASDGADDSSASNYYVQGYVADIARMPMEGVTVSVLDGTGPVFQSETDASGYFIVGVASNASLMISFTVFGYTTVTCPYTTSQPGSDYLSLNLSKVPYAASTHTYSIADSIADMQCAIMAASDGIVRGQVTFNSNPIKDATVTLTPSVDAPFSGGGNYTAQTDSRGHYEITCPTGTYNLTVSRQGFNQSDVIPVKVTGSPSTANVTMVKSELRKHLGLDNAHILMLVGVVVGIMLAMAAWFFSRRMNRSHRLEIIDDCDDDEKDVRYP